MNAVSAPAAPAYAKVSAFVVSEFPYNFREIEAPTKPPAHTIGASGPTLKPKVDVTKDKRRRGNSEERLLGRLSASAGTEENADTKSATEKLARNFDDKIPVRRPPSVQVPVMK
jgi:hypothetical protein